MSYLQSTFTSEGAPTPAFDVKAIDDYVTQNFRAKDYVGLSVVVLHEGKTVFEKNCGVRSLKSSVPIDSETVFAVGSITKQFTCACILLLAEEGKLSLQDAIGKYYPNLTRASDINLYDLMSRASGYRDFHLFDFLSKKNAQPIAPDALIAEYAGQPLEYEPGARCSYGSTGYYILGRVVEKLSGEPFGEFLTRRIFKPLGMEHSFCDPSLDRPEFATGYSSFALGDLEPAEPEASGWTFSSSGIYTTASDLARWSGALMDGTLLTPASHRILTTTRTLPRGKSSSFACAFQPAIIQGESVLFQVGAPYGFCGCNVLIPRTRSALIVLTNSDQLEIRPFFRGILALLLDEYPRSLIAGPSPQEVAREFFRKMQEGTVDRSGIGPEFDHYLSADKVRAAAARLKSLGEPVRIDVEDLRQVGGVEWATLGFTFKAARAKAVLHRSGDGRIQQFLLYRR